MKALKILGIVLAGYVAIVVLFESLIGIFQPESEQTLVITTQSESGETHDRVLARLESGGKIYGAANHWPRAWYTRAKENPNVRVTLDGAAADYRAVPVTGAEHEQVDADQPLPFFFRVLTGFPPRYFLRLDPA